MKKGIVLAAAVFAISFTAPIVSIANNNPMVQTQEEEVTYKEIEKEQLPETITEALEESFADYSIDKVFVGTDSSFKIEIGKEEVNLAVFYDQEGTLLKQTIITSDSAEVLQR